jgi:hypothetical protein
MMGSPSSCSYMATVSLPCGGVLGVTAAMRRFDGQHLLVSVAVATLLSLLQ